MNSKEIRELMEAYAAVYAPQQKEGYQRDPEGEEKRKTYSKQPDPSKPGFTGIGNMSIAQIQKMNAKIAAKKTTNEELDIFDTVLEFLQVEGYAETLEQAEWMMVNVIDEEAIGIILGEANKENKQKKNDAISKIIQKKLHPSVLPSLTYGRRELKKEEYVDEAQVANRDPDKYEREQAKKSAPVRGERTPMPPRGDKRREDFEKWYRANVR